MSLSKRLSFVLYVNIIFSLSMSGCQTIRKQAEEEKNKSEILSAQKSLIINFLNKGMPQVAHRDLRKLMIEHPKDPDFKNLMGLTQLALENPQKAATFFRESYKLKPKTAVALNLSSAYIEADQPLKAIRLLLSIQKKGLTKNYRYPERLFHNVAFAAEKDKRTSLAVKYYRKAIAENPHYYLSLMRLGQIYEKNGKIGLALKQFRTARSACNSCFDPVGGMAMNYLSQGNSRLAIATVKQFLNQKELRPADQNRAKKLLQMAYKIAQSRQQNSKTQPVARQTSSDEPRSKRRL